MTDNTSNNEPAVEAREIKSDTPPCDLHFFSQADQFSEYILQKIPELQAVAVIPLWNINLTNSPHGRIRLRNEQPSYAGQLLQMMQQLAAFGVDVHRDLITQIMAFSGAAENITKQIQSKKEELDALNAKIAAAQTEPAKN